MFRLLSVIPILLGIAAPTHADLADDLVELARVRENLQVALDSCKAFSKELIGEEYKINYQSNKFGLATDDPAWFKLAKIYDKFYDDACSYVDVDELATIFSEKYRNRFSEEELQSIVVFHYTEAGSKFVSANSEINSELNELVNQRMAQGSVEAQIGFEARLQEFWLEQDLMPKIDDGDKQL